MKIVREEKEKKSWKKDGLAVGQWDDAGSLIFIYAYSLASIPPHPPGVHYRLDSSNRLKDPVLLYFLITLPHSTQQPHLQIHSALKSIPFFV